MSCSGKIDESGPPISCNRDGGSVGGRRFCNPTRRELPGPFAELDGALDLSTAWSRTYSATFLRAAEAPTTMLRAAHFQGYVGSDG